MKYLDTPTFRYYHVRITKYYLQSKLTIRANKYHRQSPLPPCSLLSPLALGPPAVEALRPPVAAELAPEAPLLVEVESVLRSALSRPPFTPKNHAQPVQLQAGVFAHGRDAERLARHRLDEALGLEHIPLHRWWWKLHQKKKAPKKISIASRLK